MFHKTKNKNKKWFCRSCLQMLPVNVEKGIIKFENYFKELPVLFKIYADFECNFRDVEI